MNSKNDNRATAQDNAQGATKTRNYRPALSIYHANGKGTGSAVRFEVVPAASGRDGAVFMTLAQQKSVASGSREHGNRQHATFDWQNRVTVKLNFDDLCIVREVLINKGFDLLLDIILHAVGHDNTFSSEKALFSSL